MDSSFLVSSYVQDVYKAEFLRRIAQRPIIWLTPFHRVEVANAISLHVFRKKLTAQSAKRTWREFQEDIRSNVWMTVDLPVSVWETGINLTRRHTPALGFRTLDLLHVACAIELRADRFWTFDERQKKLAETVGLDTTA